MRILGCQRLLQISQPARFVATVLLTSTLFGLVACDLKQAPIKADVNVLPKLGWSVLGLHFLPAAINNSEVIVGSNETLGAVRYHNGAYTGLAHINNSTGGGPYRALDITGNGDILGIPDQAVIASYKAVTWSPPTFSASPIGNAPTGFFVPQAMNNNQLVIGWAGDALMAWKWNFAQGYKELKPHMTGYQARPTDVNDDGYVVGYDSNSSGDGRILLWAPNGNVSVLDNAAGLRGFPRIRNSGEVIWANSTQIKRWLAGTITIAAAPAGLERLTAVSESGRLAGTLKENGVLRGWTSLSGTVTYLEPINAAPGDYVEPTGINNCGSIVGVVHRTGNPDYGVYFTRSGIVYWCDAPPLATQ